MNPLNPKNLVAKILQVYAYLNAAAWVILAFLIADEIDAIVAIMLFAAGLLVSFFIYALGEIIELLNQIKLNTANTQTTNIEELPEI